MLDHKYKVFYHLAQTPNTTKVAEEFLQVHFTLEPVPLYPNMSFRRRWSDSKMPHRKWLFL